MTEAEKVLWKVIRRDSLGVRFRRQYGIGKFIADFYCPSLKLVIEVDGGGHFTVSGKKYDRVRTEYMNSIGIEVIRYKNRDVLNNMQSVIDSLLDVIDRLKKT